MTVRLGKLFLFLATTVVSLAQQPLRERITGNGKNLAQRLEHFVNKTNTTVDDAIVDGLQTAANRTQQGLENVWNRVENLTDSTNNTVDDRIVDGISDALEGLQNRTGNITGVGENVRVRINGTLSNVWDRVENFTGSTNNTIDDRLVEGLGHVLDLYRNATENSTGLLNRTQDFVGGLRNATNETESLGERLVDGLTFIWNRFQDSLVDGRAFVNTMRPCHDVSPGCGLAGY
jgi:hypothetical protein